MSDRKPNAAQQAVIDDLTHNILLFASAGTGKTFTVAQRVRRILEQGKALPEEILCLTFTIKAANEMKDDILRYVGENGNRVVTRTIHSFAYEVLKEESVRDPEFCAQPGICDDSDEADLLRRIALEMGLPEQSGILKSDAALRNVVSCLKHERETLGLRGPDEEKDYDCVYRHLRDAKPEDWQRMMLFYDPVRKRERQEEAFVRLMDTKAGAFLHAYDQALRQSGLLDFDDLICLTHRLFLQQETRARWQARFRFIVVDEMQDTSLLEYDTLRQLFPSCNVMMCGDYFQTIYQWRGSQPDKVLDSFLRDYDARRFMFSENYRSTRTLTLAGFGYLKNQYPRLMGVYCPPEVVPKALQEGDRILQVLLPSLEAEARWIYDYLSAHPAQDVTKVCIMARSNPYIAGLYDRLQKIGAERADENGPRFFSVDRDARFFRREVIRDILSFFRILVNPTDSLGFERAVEKYVSGVGKARIAQVRSNSALGLSLASFADDGLYRDGDPYETLIRAWREGRVVVYDTETTGLDLRRDQIIQISAIRLTPEGEIADTFDQMVVPTVPISEGAQRTHHQTLNDILRRGGIPTESALKKFLAFSDGMVLVGHNSLRFDAPLLRRQLRERGLPLPNILGEYDTLPIARQFLPKSPNYTLDTLCGTFGIVNEAAHDALGDITATGRVLACLMDQYILPTAAPRRAFLAEWRPKFERIHAFLSGLRQNELQRNDVAGLAAKIIDTLNLRKRYPEPVHQQTLDDFLYALRQAPKEDGELYLLDLLSDAALSGSQMDLLIKKLNKIPIITVHQSKGCEFDTVIIAGADDDQFPTYQAKVHNALEEEKRVFYVAISRAKKTLILTSTTQRVSRSGVWPVAPSRWISFIPREYIQTVHSS